MSIEKVILGNTHLQVSRVGFGVLPIGPSQLALPLEEGAEIIEYGLLQGINFIDTAQYYRTYPYIRTALNRTKSSPMIAQPVICSKSLAPDYEGMAKAIEEARISMDRDVIDIFLLHEVRSGQLSMRLPAWQCLVDAKAKGMVRAIGISTHHVDVTIEAAYMHELDVVFPLLNYKGLGIRKGGAFATAEEMIRAIETCRNANKGVFTMKVFGGGTLTGSYQDALNYVFSQPSVQSVMIGFGKTSEIDDIISYLNGTMHAKYNPDISQKKFRINQEDCEGCGACKAACPTGAIYYNDIGLAQINQNQCLTCGYCSPVCPVRAVIMY